MKLLQLNGNNEKVYAHIARFAMSKAVIREFKGYPIYTDENYTWFMVFDGTALAGFSSVSPVKNGVVFSNAYVLPEYRGKGVHKMMLNERISFCKKMGAKRLFADCTKMSVMNFNNAGFKVVAEFKDWTKVEMQL